MTTVNAPESAAGRAHPPVLRPARKLAPGTACERAAAHAAQIPADPADGDAGHVITEVFRALGERIDDGAWSGAIPPASPAGQVHTTTFIAVDDLTPLLLLCALHLRTTTS